MDIINIEIKAHSKEHDRIKEILLSHNADFKGVDHQIDTYFNATSGRLKLREGTIENSLIYYNRPNQQGPKQSDIILYKSEPGSSLKQLLTASLGILAVVDKKREIYFIDNVKFHIDSVKNLGTFVEIEAINSDGSIGKDKLLAQCEQYLALFNIAQSDLVSVSYSDLLLEKQNASSFS